jgi:EmrB/QacA subfamily drug resistance transporter
MVVLDISVVNIALPSIQRELVFPGSDLVWVVDAYTLALGSLLLFGGRVADLLGRKRTLLAGVALFVVASVVAGTAATPGVLIGARFVQGTGEALASPAALSLVTTLFPSGRGRGRAMAAYAAMGGLGIVLGQVVGGLLIQAGTWRWVFLINLPVGMLLLTASWMVLPEARGPRRRLDLPGTLTGTAALFCLVYATIRAGNDGWTSAPALAWFAIAALLVGAFVVTQLSAAEPMLPRHLFRKRTRVSAYVITALLWGAAYGFTFNATRYVQDVLGFSALQTGMAFLPFGMSLLLAAMVIRKVIGRTGATGPLLIGCAVRITGYLILMTCTIHTTYAWLLLSAFVILGLSTGLSLVTATMWGMDGVGDHDEIGAEDAGIASGVFSAAGQVGGTVGLAAIATLSASVARHHLITWSATHDGAPPVDTIRRALVSGYSAGYAVSAGLSALALIVAATAVYKRRSQRQRVDDGGAVRRWTPLIRRTHPSLLQRLSARLSLSVDFAQPVFDLQLTDAEIAEDLHYPYR